MLLRTGVPISIGRQRQSEAAGEAAAAIPTIVEQEQPRRIAVHIPAAGDAQRAPTSCEVVRIHADEIPSESLDRRPLEDDAPEEMEEESEDTEMAYLGLKSDPVMSVLLTQLGNVESANGVRGALAARADEAPNTKGRLSPQHRWRSRRVASRNGQACRV